MFLRANIIFAYLCKTPPKNYKRVPDRCHLKHSRLVLARNVVPTDWDLPQKMLTVPKLFTIPKLWPKQFQNLNWKKNLANLGVTLWALLAILPAKASRRPEPSLADRADVRRDLVRLLKKPSRNSLISICALCVYVGTFRQEGGSALAVLKGEPAESTSCFFVRTELESQHYSVKTWQTCVLSHNKEDHAGNEKAGNCSVPPPSPSCPCPCPWPWSCPCPWPLASSEESWPRSSCWWPWGRSALLLMGSVLKTSSDYFPERQRQNIPFTR